MDWGYLEFPTDEENVARFTPVVWAKIPVERHSKRDKKRIRVGIDLTVNAHLGVNQTFQKLKKWPLAMIFVQLIFF
jgi:hypothetical protein